MQRDLDNEKALRGKGWIVLRFWGKEIEENLDECIKTIEDAIFERMIQEEK